MEGLYRLLVFSLFAFNIPDPALPSGTGAPPLSPPTMLPLSFLRPGGRPWGTQCRLGDKHATWQQVLHLRSLKLLLATSLSQHFCGAMLLHDKIPDSAIAQAKNFFKTNFGQRNLFLLS